ncbi:PQQ-like beta-propeller repeat protein [Caldivirga maquilingensis]|uniref:Pyrrolo-quinoline quinone n=1 Tax=Caldivirga maquilingensis (strain ATCC 700844 / DSM 13496 / JCM 10307 / IC-167) TaxID=397948 RepID=A8MA55_CALMQ|nr:PQQ-like beta-propeller repeat protein [Caldivirga maquilingensis]ABW00987.1 Pyrrolo-quinoline quinone [Caldivirga maquilingensis IC-167]
MNRYQVAITVISIALAVSWIISIVNITSAKTNASITVTNTITQTITSTVVRTITYTPQYTKYTNVTGSNSSQLNYQFMLPYVVQSIPGESSGYWRNTVMFDGNPQHDYFVPTRTGYFMVNVTWAIIVQPTIYGYLLIVTTSGPFNATSFSVKDDVGSVCALSAINGDVVWCRVFPNQIMTQPIVINDTLVVGLGNAVLTPTYRGTGVNAVVALNVSNGNELWNYTTLGEDMPTPVYYRGMVIEADGSGDAFALNITNGKPVWIDQLGTYDSMSSLLLVNGIVYFGTSTTFWAINASNGAVIWGDYLYGTYQNMGGLDDSSPAYYGGIVVTSFTVHLSNNLMDEELVAFNATNGNILWTFYEGISPVPPNLEAPPVVIHRGIVFHDSPVGVLYAINVTNGKVLWTFKTGPTLSTVGIIGDYIIIQNRTGEMFVLSLNGDLIKTIITPVIPGPGSPLITKNSVIIAGLNGIIDSIPLYIVLHT